MVCSLQCAVCNAQCTVCSVHHAAFRLQGAVYSMYSVLSTVQCNIMSCNRTVSFASVLRPQRAIMGPSPLVLLSSTSVLEFNLNPKTISMRDCTLGTESVERKV